MASLLFLVMSSGVETSLNISDKQQSIRLVRLPTLSPLPSRRNRPCRSPHSLHSSTSLGMTSDSGVIAPVQIREKIVAPFAIDEKLFVDLPGDKLVVQFVEAGEVIERAFGCVIARPPGSHQKRPLA